MRENKNSNAVRLSKDNVDVSFLFSMLSNLYDRGLISSKTFLESFSISYEEEMNQIAKEKKDK